MASTVFQAIGTKDAFEVEGTGQETISAAIKHGRKVLKNPIKLVGFNVGKGDDARFIPANFDRRS